MLKGNKMVACLIMIGMIGFGGCTGTPPNTPTTFAPNSNDSFIDCNSNTSGRIYYNNETNNPYICDGSYWVQVDTKDTMFVNYENYIGNASYLFNDTSGVNVTNYTIKSRAGRDWKENGGI